MYDKEFSSDGEVTWIPGAEGDYSFKVICVDDGIDEGDCTSLTVGGGATTTTQPSGTTTTTEPPATTTTQPSGTTTTTEPPATTTTQPSGTTTTTEPPATTTTTVYLGDFSASSITCSEYECTLDVVENSLTEELVIFFELSDEDGRIYYSSNLNLEPGSLGEKKLIISRVRSCSSGTQLDLFVIVYRQSDLDTRVFRITDESFVC